MPNGTGRRQQVSYFNQPDLSTYMLGLPKARPRPNWFVFAIVTGTVLALAVLALGNLIF